MKHGDTPPPNCDERPAWSCSTAESRLGWLFNKRVRCYLAGGRPSPEIRWWRFLLTPWESWGAVAVEERSSTPISIGLDGRPRPPIPNAELTRKERNKRQKSSNRCGSDTRRRGAHVLGRHGTKPANDTVTQTPTARSRAWKIQGGGAENGLSRVQRRTRSGRQEKEYWNILQFAGRNVATTKNIRLGPDIYRGMSRSRTSGRPSAHQERSKITPCFFEPSPGHNALPGEIIGGAKESHGKNMAEKNVFRGGKKVLPGLAVEKSWPRGACFLVPERNGTGRFWAITGRSKRLLFGLLGFP